MKITLAIIALTALSLLSMSCGYTVTISDPSGNPVYTEPIDGEINGHFTPIEPAK